jgi:hypothetical protein
MTADPQHPPQPAGVIIPQPRSTPDDTIEDLTEFGPDNEVWRYDQRRKRNPHRRFTGHVTRVGGIEGERLRGDLAAIIRDLLDWAAHHAATSETESRQDGDHT